MPPCSNRRKVIVLFVLLAAGRTVAGSQNRAVSYQVFGEFRPLHSGSCFTFGFEFEFTNLRNTLPVRGRKFLKRQRWASDFLFRAAQGVDCVVAKEYFLGSFDGAIILLYYYRLVLATLRCLPLAVAGGGILSSETRPFFALPFS